MAKTTKFHDIKGVEVFDVGKWNGRDWTDEDLDEMVENFAELAPTYDFPAKLGHGDAQELLKAEGLPAAAWIKKLYRKGTKLAADLERVPEKLYELVKNGAYKQVSAEIYEKVQLNGKAYKNVLSAIAFLGGEIPAVGTLDDILALYQRADPHVLAVDGAARRTIVSFATKVEDEDEDDLEDDAVKLEADLESLAERAKAATKGTRGAPAFRTFLTETLSKLRGLRKAKNAIGDDTSAEVLRSAIEKALRDQFGGYPYVIETFTDYVVVEREGRYWQTPYAISTAGEVELSPGVEVERTWRPKNNAGPTGEEEADMATTKAVLAALGLPENADEQAQLAAIDGLKATKTTNNSATDDRITKLEASNATLVAELAKRDATSAVDGAITSHKLLPAQKDWALEYASKDPAGFQAYVEKTPEVFKTTELGGAGDAPETKSDVAAFQAKVAEKVKAGATVENAQRDVAAEEPELFAAIRARR